MGPDRAVDPAWRWSEQPRVLHQLDDRSLLSGDVDPRRLELGEGLDRRVEETFGLSGYSSA